MLLFLTTLIAAAQGDEVREAEHVRLSETMRRLASRNAWEGVDRSYRQLDGLALVLTYDDHYIGAQAAWALGDAGSTRTRLERALTVEADEGVKQWLAEIHHNYTIVQLSGPGALTSAEVPFAADQRAALAYAEVQLAEESRFNGMLPNGRYTFGEHAFELFPGSPSVIIGKGPGRSRGGGLSVGPLLPAASLGLALTRAGAPAGIVLQPAGFSGPGLRLGIGPEVSLGGALGAKAEVGYHGLLTADSQLHLGYAWLAATWSIAEDGLIVSIGPGLGMGRAKTIGLERTVYEEYCTANPGDLHCGWVDLAALDDMALAAWVRTVGLTAGASRHLRTMGSVRSGVSLLGGLQTDSHRWYPWAELAVTFHGGGDL
ncbi:MAG: hypothetical protein P8R54_15875 [Myxococcota bacterium]|nr:hypothetical protein [Myxococcota bacterium]